LEASYLFIQADLVFAPVHKLVELSLYSKNVNYTISYFATVWTIIDAKVPLSVSNANSKWTSSPSTWPTGGRISATFSIRTPSLALHVSAEGMHDLHGVALERLDASTLSLSPLSRRKLGRSRGTVASSSALHTASLTTKARPWLRCTLLSTFHPQAHRETLW